MNIDVHAHDIPPESLKVANEIGRHHGIKLEKDERGRDALRRDDRPFLTSLKASFPISICVCRSWTTRASICRLWLPPGLIFLLAARCRRAGICPLAERPIRRSRRETSSALCCPGLRTNARRCDGRRRIGTAMTKLGPRGDRFERQRSLLG
jgi:hypothetical protein